LAQDHSHHHPGHAGHGDPHHHGHGPTSHGQAFAIGVVLNLLFVGLEWGFGVLSHSLALMADAAHNLGDVLGLLVAWGGMRLAQRLPSERFTYGLRGSSILAALTNAIVLLLITGGLAWEAVQRFANPQPVVGGIVIAVALAGVLVNGFTAWLFMSGSKQDINMRGAYLHMASDAAVSLGVAVAGGVVWLVGWLWLDPLVTLLLALVIIGGTWGLLRDSLRLALQAVPETIDAARVRVFLAGRPGVSEVHDLHIWAMSTTENALTAHLVMPGGHPGDAFLQAAMHDIEHQFGIHHATLQVELGDSGTPCTLAPEHVV
jgi:cobalt-zinc-cadmium efflux system protein